MEMILVSGYGLTAASWGPLLAIWGEPAPTAAAVELPGHGSRAIPESEDPADPRMWVDGLERAIGDAAEPVLVIAFSMGVAALAHRLAASGTRGLAGCVLLGGVPGQEEFSREYQSLAAGILTGRADADASLVELYATSPTARSLVAADLARLALPARRAAADLPVSPSVSISVPTLVIYGADDAVTRPPDRQRLTSLGADVELAMVSGAGHAVHLDAPDTVAKTIQRWLSSSGLDRTPPPPAE
ncbi:alpha/beta fold hydrolase [Kineosporia mesophila]|uniref:Alpha/beta fold hydrolase n=1 Tax=Kineosporia mesophila TaxID=566012 RepID=A0ABP7AMK7_9ACTN|nr:alpha/beta hydrolase [Kineosporia mesophila]MCD5349400.1 alpha/beta hydrolase [Kineosporia mesophila]